MKISLNCNVDSAEYKTVSSFRQHYQLFLFDREYKRRRRRDTIDCDVSHCDFVDMLSLSCSRETDRKWRESLVAHTNRLTTIDRYRKHVDVIVCWHAPRSVPSANVLEFIHTHHSHSTPITSLHHICVITEFTVSIKLPTWNCRPFYWSFVLLCFQSYFISFQ